MSIFACPQPPLFDLNHRIVRVISAFEQQEAALNNLISNGPTKDAYWKKFKEFKKYCKEHSVRLVALNREAWGMLETELTRLTKRFKKSRKALVAYYADHSPESESTARSAFHALKNELTSLQIDPRGVCVDWLANFPEPALTGGHDHNDCARGVNAHPSTNGIQRTSSKSEPRKPKLQSVPKEKSEADTDGQMIMSLCQAMQDAEKKYKDRLVFSLNSKSNVATPFKNPEQVENAFKWLATIYRDAKRGERNCPDLDASIRDSIDAGWFWRGGQAEQTASTYSNWYECNYDGKRHSVREHVGSGKSKKPEQTIRIAFTWLESEQLVLIGFIGQHQKSDRT